MKANSNRSMKKKGFLIKTIKYSMKLVYESSGLMMVPYFFAYLLCASFPLFTTYMLKLLIDELTIGVQDLTRVLVYILFYALSVVLVQLFEAIRTMTENVVIEKAGYTFECRMLEHVAGMPLELFDTTEGKDMIDEVRYSKNTMTYILPRLAIIVSYAYSFIVAYSVVFSFHKLFAGVFLLLTIPGIIMKAKFDKKMEDFRMKNAPDVRKFCYYRWMLTDIYPARDVRMYDLTEPIKKRYCEEKAKYCKENKKLDLRKLIMGIGTEIVKRSGEVLFTVFTVIKAFKGEIGIGDATMYIGFAITVTESFQSMLDLIVYSYSITTESMRRVFDFFGAGESKEQRKGDLRKLNEFQSLVFDNVTFSYPKNETNVLNGVSFRIDKGDKVVIVGVNGAGKSTLIKLMLGLYQIDSGEIRLNGHPICEYDIKDVRRLFSVLFQEFVKYPLTLRENVSLSDCPRESTDDEVIYALKQSGFYDEIVDKVDNNLDAFMTRRFSDDGVELSKGQWQKVAVARLYYKKAQIAIFDEPSSALDAEAEDRIFGNFEKISDGKTGIMISHRISSARLADKILVLDGGKIVENGTHDELIKNDALYAELYNMQKENYI